MADSLKLIEVFYDDHAVGRLALTPDRLAAFEYDNGWLRTGFSISPFYLPLKPGVMLARPTPFEGLFGVFADSLPDGWGRLLTDRWLKTQGTDPNSLSQLDRLALVGDGGMGALTYRPNRNPGRGELRHPLQQVAEMAAGVLEREESPIPDELMKLAGSSGGARPKVLVSIDGAEWLIKFRASIDPKQVGEIEYRYAGLAKQCGIEMPETRLFEGSLFGVKRFDRNAGGRVHMHSAAGLLYADHRLPSLDYTGLMKATMALTRDINETARMFRLMVFNVKIGNKDDHAKNFSFIHDGARWKLSPAYDLLPSRGLGGQHTTTVAGNGNPSMADCLEVARLTGFPMKRATDIIEEVEEVLIKGFALIKGL